MAPIACLGLVLALASPSEEAESVPEDPFAAGPELGESGEGLSERTPEPTKLVARARLRGRVLVFGGRDPIPSARLVPKAGGEPTEVDTKGEFAIYLDPGTHTFAIRAPGFEALETTVELKPKQDLEMEFRLEVAIEGQRYRTVVRQEREVAVSSTTLRDEEMRSVAGTRGDPLRVVKSLPGVSQLAGFLPYVVVRGAAPGNTGYYLDGTRVPILYHVAIGPSVIHPYFIDAVDFYPSGAPVRLGRFASGIIEARTRPAQRDRVHGDFDARFTDAGGILEVPIDKRVLPGCKHKQKRKCEKAPARGAIALAGRYSYSALILSLVQSSAKIRYWDYQGRVDHSLGPRADYVAFGYGSFDELGTKATTDNMGNEVPARTFVKFQFHRIDNRIRQRLRNKGQATYALVLGVDQTQFDPDAGDPDAEPSGIDTKEWRVAPRIDVRQPLSDTMALGFGLDQEFQIFRLGTGLDEQSDVGDVEDLAFLLSDRVVTATGLYVELMWQKGNVQVRPGLRGDLYFQFGPSPYVPSADTVTHAIGLDPRLLLRERLNDRWALRQAVGLYHQPPSAPIPIPGIESFGFDRGLQRNLQGSFGYELRVVPGVVQLEQEAYVGWLTNLQDYELQETAETMDELEDFITQVTGWAYGLETMLKLDPTLKLYGWAAYTLSRSTREFAGGQAPSNWDQRHILNLVLGYRLSHKWSLGGRVHYNTGRPWTAREGNQTETEALIQNRNNARLPPFFQLDLRVERNWTFPNWQLQLVLDIANATYSREVFQCQDPDMSEGGASVRKRMAYAQKMVLASRGVVDCSELGFRYIIPSLGLRGRF